VLTFSDFSAIISSVSERKNNEMNNEMNKIEETNETNTVLVSCCGCNEELHISHEEADQWTDTDWFQCHECE
jgi:acetamidase/formamidase